MDKLLKEARGRDCQIRLEGICNFNSETTVACHHRQIGLSGAGMKSPSICVAWGCSSCHDAVDRRSHMELEREYVELALLRGVMRTIAILVSEGKIKC